MCRRGVWYEYFGIVLSLASVFPRQAIIPAFHSSQSAFLFSQWASHLAIIFS
jgi:hypothetical protein